MNDKRDQDAGDVFKPDFEDTVEQSTDQGHDEGRATFNPFADVGKVDTGIGAVLNAPAVNPADGGMINQEGVEPSRSFLPHPQEEEDVKPGSGRDLWTCPHCGAKNKPGRDTCRSCGKSPSDPVASPLVKKLVLLGGSALLLLIAIAFFVWGGTDTSFKPAAAASIDGDIRVGGDRIAATGRVLASASSEHGQRAVLLVFGQAALDEETFQTLRPEIDAQINVKRGEQIAADVSYALIHLVSEDALPDAERGDYFSVAGDELLKPALKRFEYVVGVDEIAVRSP